MLGKSKPTKWEGSPSELLEQLRPITKQYKIDTNQRLGAKALGLLAEGSIKLSLTC